MCFYLSFQFRIIVSKKTRVGMLQLCQFLPERRKEKQICTGQFNKSQNQHLPQSNSERHNITIQF